MTNGEIFRKAADYIRRYGWMKGGFGDKGGPRCVVGSVGAICDWEMWGDAIMDAPNKRQAQHLLQAMAARLGLSVTGRDMVIGIAHWNDSKATEPEEVIALLDGLAFDEDLKAAATAPTPTASSQEAILPTLKEAVPA